MKVQFNSYQPNFNAKIVNNNAFKEVINYAKSSGKLSELDSILHKIDNANSGNILIIHGKTPMGIFSSFTWQKPFSKMNSVQNLTLGANSPAEASYNALVELSALGRKFRKLVGGNIKENITEESIIKNYSVKA